MEGHSIDEGAAFEMLRERSRNANRKLIDLAAAIPAEFARSDRVTRLEKEYRRA